MPLIHAETLEYGWWKHDRQPLPDTLKDKKNFLLHAQEVDQYVEILAEMKKRVDAAYAQANLTAKVLRGGRVPTYPYDENPQPITLAHVLEFMCSLAKSKLAVLQFLEGFTKNILAKKEQQ